MAFEIYIHNIYITKYYHTKNKIILCSLRITECQICNLSCVNICIYLENTNLLLLQIRELLKLQDHAWWLLF